MTWASRRRATYLSVLLLIVVLIVGWVGFRVLYTPPTCFDGKQNGTEAGIDCGGTCERVCSFQAVDAKVLWSRFFEVAPGVYNAVTLIENPNLSAEAQAVPYSFKFYDGAGVLVYERKGSTAIPPVHQFAVFEAAIVTGERTPQRSFFEFTVTPTWERSLTPQPDLHVSAIQLIDSTTQPRLRARLHNRDLTPVENIEVIAILLSETGNAVGVSRTVVPRLSGEGTEELIFTWPRPFEDSVAKIELLPQVAL